MTEIVFIKNPGALSLSSVRVGVGVWAGGEGRYGLIFLLPCRVPRLGCCPSSRHNASAASALQRGLPGCLSPEARER